MTKRKLGTTQLLALCALRDWGRYPNAWMIGTHSKTVRILDSLVVRGLVKRESGHGRIQHVYTLTDAGKERIND